MPPHQSPVAEPIPFEPRFCYLFICLSPVIIELSGKKKMTLGESQYFDVLCKLPGAYEDKRFPIERMTPIEALEYLMEENELTRAQIGEIIGCRPNRVTEILNGTKELSKEQIVRLSARFKVSTDLFMPKVLKTG